MKDKDYLHAWTALGFIIEKHQDGIEKLRKLRFSKDYEQSQIDFINEMGKTSNKFHAKYFTGFYENGKIKDEYKHLLFEKMVYKEEPKQEEGKSSKRSWRNFFKPLY